MHSERAWFGCHSSSVSLVVGGIYFAASHRTAHTSEIWLLVDGNPPSLAGIDDRPIRSSKGSQHTLLWAHADSLGVVSQLIASSPLWEAFRSATTKVQSASSSSSDRDGVQVRRRKRRLSGFWYIYSHGLRSEEARQPGPLDLDEYHPIGSDLRELVECQIRERRGQREFRSGCGALRTHQPDVCQGEVRTLKEQRLIFGPGHTKG